MQNRFFLYLHHAKPMNMMTPDCIRTYCFSPTGTSRKTAAAIARGLARPEGALSEIPIRVHDLTHKAAPTGLLSEREVALFAVPVYGGHVPPLALKRLEEIRGDRTPAVIVAVYGNRAFEKAASELAVFVRERGFVPVAAAAFVGEHSYSSERTPIAAGRPDAEDLAAAEAFGRAIRHKITQKGAVPVEAARLKDPATPLIPLLRFIGFVLSYRRRQKKHPVLLLPAGDEALCTHCGRCAAICPTGAITRGDELHTDPERCIRCCACVKGCPVGARRFDTPFAAALARNFTRRKPPVTLL